MGTHLYKYSHTLSCPSVYAPVHVFISLSLSLSHTHTHICMQGKANQIWAPRGADMGTEGYLE